MIQNSAKRFLEAELERIETGLNWIDSAYRPDLAAEYQRRKQVVRELMDAAVTNEDALNTIEHRLRNAELRIDEMVQSHRSDATHTNLIIDVEYLHGLYNRMQRAITDNTYIYALENVKRL